MLGELIQTEKLNLGYENKMIVNDLNMSVPEGKITALVGANGSGKSTILNALARIMKPKDGTIYLDGKAIHEQKTKTLAKKMAILPQNPVAPGGLTVGELVAYGRFPHQKGFGNLSKQDKKVIHWALSVSGMLGFAERDVDALSGGQRQKAWVAMALAQETGILFLDEPTTFLDMAHQLEVLHLLKKLNEEENRTIVMVVHDLNHASRFAHHMIAIKEGAVVEHGTPFQVMNEGMLQKVFSIRADIIEDPKLGVPLCLPYGLCGNESFQTSQTIRKPQMAMASR